MTEGSILEIVEESRVLGWVRFGAGIGTVFGEDNVVYLDMHNMTFLFFVSLICLQHSFTSTGC